MNRLIFSTYNPNSLVSTSYDGTVRSLDLAAQKSVLLFGSEDDEDLYTSFHAQLDAASFLVTLGSSGEVGLVDTRQSNLKFAK